AGSHPDPHTVLGAHPAPDGTIVRVLRPEAESVSIRVGGADHRLAALGHGVFGGTLPYPELLDYRVVTVYPHHPTTVLADGYRHLPTLGDLDLHLIGEGRHQRLWEVLGAHPRRYPG